MWLKQSSDAPKPRRCLDTSPPTAKEQEKDDDEQDEADALLKLVIEVSEEQPTPSAGQDFHRVQSEREVRKFLKSIDFRQDGA